MEEFTLKTSGKRDVVDITERVAKAIERRNGSACLVFVPHTTAAVTVNEYEPNIKQDYVDFFERLAPEGNYRHNKIDDNAQAHLVSALLNASVVIPVYKGKLMLGTWQRVLVVEGDGPRNRTVYVQVLQ